MATKDKDQSRKIGHIKLAANIIILVIFVPLLWLMTSLSINHPTSFRIYTGAFIVLLITAIVLPAVADRIVDRKYSKKKN